MGLTEILTRERLNRGLTDPHFLDYVSKIVDKSDEKGLVGRFGLFYSEEDDRFYTTDLVCFYDESDLVNEELDHYDFFHFEGAKHQTLWPRIDSFKDLYQDNLVAQFYTVPKDYEEPVVRAFNLGDLGVARMAINILKMGEDIFRPFGVVVDKYLEENSLRVHDRGRKISYDNSVMTFNFYSEVLGEPYLDRMRREGRSPRFEEIANAGNLTSPINLIMALLKMYPESQRTHSFSQAEFVYHKGRFRGEVEPDVLEDLVLWDTT